jgi:hypothetical protein
MTIEDVQDYAETLNLRAERSHGGVRVYSPDGSINENHYDLYDAWASLESHEADARENTRLTILGWN